VVLAAMSAWIVGRGERSDPPTRGFELIPVEGQSPRITPDGSELVHVSPDGREIWRVPLGQGNPQMVWAGETRILSLELAPDGRAVVFGLEAGGTASMWEVPITGGLARKLGRGVPVAVSPSGETVLSLIRRAPAHSDLTVGRRDGTGQGLVHAFRGALVPRAAAFLDESHALVSLTDGLRVSRLVSVRLSDGAAETVTEVAGVAESGLAVVDSARCAVWCVRRSSESLFLPGVTDLQAGGFRLMLAGPNSSDPSVSEDGKRLLLQTPDRTSELVEVEVAPGGDQPASGYRVLPHTRDAGQPRVSRDGRRLAFQSARSNLWILDRQSGSVGPFLTTGEASFNAAWSPDGSLVAYSCLHEHQSELWVAGADGGDPRPLTREDSNDFQPLWHADGRHLLFISDRDGREDLYRLEIATGDVVRLHDEGAINPAVSRDGRSVAFVVPSEQGHGWLRVHALESDVTLGRLLWERHVVRDSWAGAKPRFSPDGRWLAFDRPAAPFGADVWAVEAQTGEGLHRLTQLPFPAGLLAWFDWVDDRRLVITVARRPNRFLVLHDLPRWLERSLRS
jgi:Tol biopolymer transport system component